MTEYIDQIKELFINGKKIKLHRRIDKRLSHEDPEYINGYWEDQYTGDEYKYNINTNEAKCIFKFTR